MDACDSVNKLFVYIGLHDTTNYKKTVTSLSMSLRQQIILIFCNLYSGGVILRIVGMEDLALAVLRSNIGMTMLLNLGIRSIKL